MESISLSSRFDSFKSRLDIKDEVWCIDNPRACLEIFFWESENCVGLVAMKKNYNRPNNITLI